ncbi:39S ribosomal protein L17, mitochondrial [Gryllus bimaculatus]|nr:39S ribosomal protein L17, mitochondrial [Gryllus bimaculatus]
MEQNRLAKQVLQTTQQGEGEEQERGLVALTCVPGTHAAHRGEVAAARLGGRVRVAREDERLQGARRREQQEQRQHLGQRQPAEVLLREALALAQLRFVQPRGPATGNLPFDFISFGLKLIVFKPKVIVFILKLRINVAPRHRNLKNPDGPEGRLLKLRKTVTGLIKHERIELNYNRADEARGYAERLISEAIRYGDCHRTTMELADFWLLEKQLVHKLFKVLVPRNPYPPLTVDSTKNRALLHNVLLDEAAKAYRAQKVTGVTSEILEKIEREHPSSPAVETQEESEVTKSPNISEKSGVLQEKSSEPSYEKT